MKIVRMGSVVPKPSRKNRITVKCEKCGTKVRLDEGEYHTDNYDSVKWDCPLCGKVKSELPPTAIDIAENCITAISVAVEFVLEHLWGFFLGLFLAVILILAHGCTYQMELESAAPYKFYVRSGTGDQYTYYSQIEPEADDKGVIWYVDVNGDEQILSGYELVAVIEQGGNKDGTD